MQAKSSTIQLLQYLLATPDMSVGLSVCLYGLQSKVVGWTEQQQQPASQPELGLCSIYYLFSPPTRQGTSLSWNKISALKYTFIGEYISSHDRKKLFATRRHKTFLNKHSLAYIGTYTSSSLAYVCINTNHNDNNNNNDNNA